MTDTLQEQIQKISLRLKILWVGQFLSFAMYVMISNILSRQKNGIQPPPEDTLIIFTSVMGGIALFSIIASFVIRRLALSETALANYANGNTNNLFLKLKPNTPVSFLSSSLPDDMPEKEQKIAKLLPTLFSLHILQWGALHTCSITGLAASIISRGPNVLYCFTAVNIFFIVFQFPNLPKLIESALAKSDYL